MNLDRIASLIASGLKASQVATIVGCNPSRISQILTQEDFKLLLAPKLAEAEENFSESVALDAKYLNVEHLLLNAVADRMASAELKDITAALRAVAEAKYRKATVTNPTQGGTIHIQNIVQLSLPSHAIQTPVIDISATNEVTAINEQTLAPLSSQGVENLFKSLSKENKNDTSRIPASPESYAPQAVQKVLVLEDIL